MSAVLTGSEMQSCEAVAMASGVVTGADLMEAAGGGVVSACLARWPDLQDGQRRAEILCGPGNNGGDGFVVARLLAKRGWNIHLRLLGDPGRLRGDAAENYRQWCDIGQTWPFSVEPDRDATVDLVVDALFGTGLRRGLAPEVTASLNAALARARNRVAVDILSGICADSGRVLGDEKTAAASLQVDLTVTFHRPKPGHFLANGAQAGGALKVVDIGLPSGQPDWPDLPSKVPAELVERDLASPAAIKAVEGHKYGNGHALVVSGGTGATGAARLAARAALRIGAGLVTLGVPMAARPEVAATITALMMRDVEDAPALEALLQDRRINALCLGPGMGLDRAAALVPEALAAGRGVVLDADALSAFAKAPATLFAAIGSGAAVLTPHDGEFARLFPDLAARLRGTPPHGPAYSRLDAVRDAARRSGAVVLLKGPTSVIAAPDGRVRIHAALRGRAAPWLATAGTGDVLAGLVTGMLARGFAPFDAVGMAAWLHVEAARGYGPGLISEDLPEAIPAVLRALQSSEASSSSPEAWMI
ncbi:NAD(P)H-hydrate dehydratase [Pseudooceanicola algae]|nr:NAD(P)H-hydrate dehydratase [Pseudooceanicola algae]